MEMLKKFSGVCLLVAVAGSVAFAADYRPVHSASPLAIKAVTADTTLTVGESGQYVYVTGVATEVTLPTAAAGLNYYIVRASATAGQDVIVNASSGDTIDGVNAITNDVDALGAAVHIVAVDAASWFVSGAKSDH